MLRYVTKCHEKHYTTFVTQLELNLTKVGLRLMRGSPILYRPISNTHINKLQSICICCILLFMYYYNLVYVYVVLLVIFRYMSYPRGSHVILLLLGSIIVM